MEGLHHDTNLEPARTSADAKVDVTNDVTIDTNDSGSASLEVREDFASQDLNKNLSVEDKINLYDQMVRIRRFEERSLRAYQQGHIGGFLHLYIGQEADAVGSVSVLGEDDHVITAYRDHGHAIAVGMNMDECMAELYGKKTGCSKGKVGRCIFLHQIKISGGGMG